MIELVKKLPSVALGSVTLDSFVPWESLLVKGCSMLVVCRFVTDSFSKL